MRFWDVYGENVRWLLFDINLIREICNTDCGSNPWLWNALSHIDYPAQARLRGSRSDKTESGLLSGLSREASTKRRSDISRISNSFQVVGLIQRPSKSPCKRACIVFICSTYIERISACEKRHTWEITISQVWRSILLHLFWSRNTNKFQCICNCCACDCN